MRAFLFLPLLAACAAPAPDLRAGLTRDAIDAFGQPLLYVETTGGASLLRADAQNGPIRTWRADEGVSLSAEGGVIVATRGLGGDLMSADVTGTRVALAGGPRDDYPRLHSYLDGENVTQFRAFRCEMTLAPPERIASFGLAIAVTRAEETCYSTMDPIRNTYWLGGDGTAWRTRQWVSDRVGHVVTELLRPSERTSE